MPPLMLVDYERLRGILDEYRRNILLNVATVITTGLYTDPAFELIAQQDNFKYYRFVPYKPRAYLVEAVQEVGSSVEAAAVLGAPDFDYWHTAVVMGNTGLEPGTPLAPAENAAVVSRTANSITIRVTAETQRFLVLADTNYPGWEAAIDGRSTPIYQTNVALRGMVVEPGTHTIIMRFRPITLFVGAAVSLLTLLSVLIWSGLSLATRKK
jgi:hypothetical protein